MKVISNIAAVLWFFGVMIWMVFGLVFMLFGIIFMDIIPMLKTGFPSSTIGFTMLIVFGFIFAITGWVPAFRKCYYKLPWLYPLCTILTMDMIIISIAEVILSTGFSVISTPRHVVTIILMVVQIVVCRLAMCIYLKKFPMVLHKYDLPEDR